MKKFKFKIDGSEYEVSINEIEHNIAEIEVNGTPFTVEIEKQEKASSMSTMRAVQVVGYHKHLEMTEMPAPEPDDVSSQPVRPLAKLPLVMAASVWLTAI